jgi:hypothetical protein
MDLVHNGQAELSITAPPVREVPRIRDVQIHREVVHIVPLGEDQHTPAREKNRHLNQNPPRPLPVFPAAVTVAGDPDLTI